ncbi:MAG: DUF58 domain-containing protein [Fimbriimonadaceae bacterium]|nr:DUF58 domain-containing protein [Fimbriimonadaceae bacterium]
MLIPTRRLWWLIAIGIPIALLGAVIPGAEYLLIPYNIALAILFFASGLSARKWDVIRVTRKAEPILSVRVPNLVTLAVENLSDQRMTIRLRDVPPQGMLADDHEWKVNLLPGEERTLRYHITPVVRGQEEFEGVFVRYIAPMGLAEIQKKLPVVEPARVYPNVQALKEYDLLKQKGKLQQMGFRKTRIRGLGQEFESLRDYNDDDIRKVDWKATARRGRLTVKNYEEERNQAVVLCVDNGRSMLGEVNGISKLDYALDAALMLMHAAANKGDQVGLMMFNDVVSRIALPRKGHAQVASLLERIHDVHAEPVQTDYVGALGYLRARWKKRSLIVVFTDAEDPDAARDLVAALSPLRKRHLVFVVRVDDPGLKSARATYPETMKAAYLRTAALWYGHERDEASRILEAAGVQNIDAEPQDLSAALVSAYLVVKERALL